MEYKKIVYTMYIYCIYFVCLGLNVFLMVIIWIIEFIGNLISKFNDYICDVGNKYDDIINKGKKRTTDQEVKIMMDKLFKK